MKVQEIIIESTELEEGWKSKLGAAALAGAAALGGGHQDAQAYQPPAEFVQDIKSSHEYDGLNNDVIRNMYNTIQSTIVDRNAQSFRNISSALGELDAYHRAGMLTPQQESQYLKMIDNYEQVRFILSDYAKGNDGVQAKFYRSTKDFDDKSYQTSSNLSRNKTRVISNMKNLDGAITGLSDSVSKQLNKIFAEFSGYSKQNIEYEKEHPEVKDMDTWKGTDAVRDGVSQRIAQNRYQSSDKISLKFGSTNPQQINDYVAIFSVFSEAGLLNQKQNDLFGEASSLIKNYDKTSGTGNQKFAEIMQDKIKANIKAAQDAVSYIKKAKKDNDQEALKRISNSLTNMTNTLDTFVSQNRSETSSTSTQSSPAPTPAASTYKQDQSPSSTQSPKSPEVKQTTSKVGFDAKTTGKGTGLTKNGDRYTGEWKDGFADGRGERTLVNKGYTGGMVKTGNKLDTQWKGGVPVNGAEVKVTTPDGKVFNGHIKRGDENPWGYMVVK